MFLMVKFAKLGPSALKTGRYHHEQSNNELASSETKNRPDKLDTSIDLVKEFRCLIMKIFACSRGLLLGCCPISFIITSGFDMGVAALLPVLGKSSRS